MTQVLKDIKNTPLKDIKELYISSKFGNRTFYNSKTKKYESDHHNGIDITNGNIVIAYESGVVVNSRNNVTGYSEKYSTGNYVNIEHGNSIMTTYCHMKYGSVSVKKGDLVQKGQIIGEKGTTGHSTGPHLHFGIKINNKWVNPEDYLLGNKSFSEEKQENNQNQDYIEYKIKKGDTLTSIASSYNTTINELVKINNISNPNLIITGKILKIPSVNSTDEVIYIVKKGDNLTKIAKKYNTSWKKIYEKNKEIIGSNPSLIKVGQKLII